MQSTFSAVITVTWQFIRQNRLRLSVETDKNLSMSNAALASDNIVSLDDYRRSRGDKKTMPPRLQTVPVTPAAPAMWVYWVPDWVW
jgi:hypothetical protein